MPSSTPLLRPTLAGAFLLLLAVLPAGVLSPRLNAQEPAALQGTVTTADGVPIEGARVEAIPQGEVVAEATTATDGRGRFTVRDVPFPLTLVIDHPRFQPEVLELSAAPGEPVAALLRPRQQVFEQQIVVSAGRDVAPGFRPVSVASVDIEPEEKPAPPRTLVELIEGTPGVAENGQGGLFQVYSIRGVSRQRVLTQVDGMKIQGERRAGQSAHFIDPLLLEGAEVLRGPSSAYYGSGAIGGVVQLFSRSWEGPTVDLGGSTQGDELWASAATGGEDWSLGLVHRRADDAETPDGERIYSRFERTAAVVEKSWAPREDLSVRLLALPVIAQDIGKPNREFPERTTTYPEEEHLLVKAEVIQARQWRVYLWGHPNTLETEVVEGSTRELVENEAFNFGANAQREWSFGDATSVRTGVDWFARRGVTATERIFEDGVLTAPAVRTLDDASEDEVAAYASLRHPLGPVTLEAGGRLTYIDQGNEGAESRDDNAWTGFVAATLPLHGGFELAANLGTGFRFPTLSERFFTGVTGRGEIISNPDLDPEQALSFDLGVRYYGDRLFAEGWAFRSEIDDYIERIRLPSGARTFVNLTSGTLTGFEANGFFALRPDLRLTWSGQTIEGESEENLPLADIPADRITLGARWEGERLRVSGRVQHRFAKDDPGDSEVPLASAEVVSAAAEYQLRDGLWLSLSGDNLLDETYLPSADDQSIPAAARSFSLSLRWNRWGGEDGDD